MSSRTILFLVFLFAFFFTAAHFTLLAAGISHFLTAAMKFNVFLPTKFASFVFNYSP